MMSAERIRELLGAHGVSLTLDDAEFILTFMVNLSALSRRIAEQNILLKPVLNFEEACDYLSISASHLYKLTAQKDIPHYCPQGKKIYFDREEIEGWLLRNKQSSHDEIEKAARDYVLRNRRRR